MIGDKVKWRNRYGEIVDESHDEYGSGVEVEFSDGEMVLFFDSRFERGPYISELQVIMDDDYDESMDGDHETALRDAGWGTDEDYGHYDLWDDPFCTGSD